MTEKPLYIRRFVFKILTFKSGSRGRLIAFSGRQSGRQVVDSGRRVGLLIGEVKGASNLLI